MEHYKTAAHWQFVICRLALVIFQQHYARTHQYGIEQPVTPMLVAEYYFRHPEALLGWHFDYPVRN